MDFGVYLKKTNKNPGRKSAHYTKQKNFKGSDRQIRGQILKILLQDRNTEGKLLAMLKIEKNRLRKLLNALIKEGFVTFENDHYLIVSH